MEPQDPEEKELADHRRQEDERGEACDRCRPRHLGRWIGERERDEHRRSGEHRARGQDGADGSVHAQLAVHTASRVRERREHDGERAGDCPPAAVGMDAREQGDAGDPDCQPGDLCRPERLVREEAEAEQRDEDRDRGLRDPCDARVDVCLSPRDERHRNRRVDRSEDEARTPSLAELAHRTSESHSVREVAEQEDAREEHARLGHRRRWDVLDGDLDEQVRGAPHRREDQEQQRPVARHGSRLPACRSARPFDVGGRR